MKIIHQTILIILVTYGYIVNAQTESKLDSKDQFSTNAEFIGGQKAMMKIIEDNLIYPRFALEAGIGGEVITQFVIDTLGHVNNIEIVKGIRDDINKEAIRLIGLLNDWTPATLNGKKVRVQFNYPLYFFPDDNFKRKYKKKHNIDN